MFFYILCVIAVLVTFYYGLAKYLEGKKYNASMFNRLKDAFIDMAIVSAVCAFCGFILLGLGAAIVRADATEVTATHTEVYQLEPNSPIEVDGGNLKFVYKTDTGEVKFKEVNADLVGVADGKKTMATLTKDDVTMAGLAPWPINSITRVIVK